VQVMQLPGQLEIVLPYLIIPVLIWAGMRFGVAATATCGFVLANAANAANALGHGASALDVSDGHAITLIQIFIGIGLTTGLVVAALSHELASEVAARTVLAHLAGHDHLTGLPNRKLLLERTRAALDAPNGPGASVGVLYVDLDGFKSINDRLGHAVGDLVLTEVARRLDQGSRPGDTVARVGGDEFIVLCPEISDEHQLAELAERLARLASEPFTYEGQQLDIRASIGTALAADPTVSPHDLIEASDRAMYQAKREQRLLHEHASSASIHPG
jgi:diguanylate cyclase (GGDEF)-like protein